MLSAVAHLALGLRPEARQTLGSPTQGGPHPPKGVFRDMTELHQPHEHLCGHTSVGSWRGAPNLE